MILVRIRLELEEVRDEPVDPEAQNPVRGGCDVACAVPVARETAIVARVVEVEPLHPGRQFDRADAAVEHSLFGTDPRGLLLAGDQVGGGQVPGAAPGIGQILLRGTLAESLLATLRGLSDDPEGPVGEGGLEAHAAPGSVDVGTPPV